MKIPYIVIKKYLKGKTIYSFGDSLVYGLSTGEGILDGLCNTYEMIYNKYAINGGSIIQRTNKIITQVEGASDEQPDFVVFDGMINDTELPDASIGTISSVKDDSQDKTTFCGAFEHLCYTLQHKYSNAHIIYVTPHRMPIRALEAKERLHNLVLQMCEKWEIPVVDIYTISDIDTNITWMRVAYSVDADNVRPGNGLHLTGEGYDLYYAPFILEEMTTNINMNITQQLIALNEAKQDIKAALIEKGQTAGDNMHEYAEAIDNISGEVDNTDYLCFEAIEDSAVSLSNFGDNAPDIEYSFNKQTWTQWDYNSIDLPAGTKIYFRGDNENGFCTGDTIYSTFAMTGSINANGDLVYILRKDGNITDGPDYCFRNLFSAQTAIQTAPKISLKYIGEMGCGAMFYQCTNLHYSPDIEIERYGYRALNYMFHTADLIFPPQFKHIAELEEGCFRSMFAYNT